MTALTWFVRLIIFSLLLAFAVQNTDPVSLNFLGLAWQAPLVVILLAFFVSGALLGVFSVLGLIYRQRREISRLKRLADKQPTVVSQDIPPVV